MGRRVRRLVVSVAAAVGLLAAATGAAADRNDDSTIVLQVTDYARVPREYLSQAEEHATKIFQAIGVRVQWIHGSNAGEAKAGRLLNVIILSGSMADLKCQESGIGDSAFGVTAKPTGRANVFFTRTSAFATRHYLDGAQLLGSVIAHEVGHLLLPVNSHSADGIMRAVWETPGKQIVTFTREQGVLIRGLLINDRATLSHDARVPVPQS